MQLFICPFSLEGLGIGRTSAVLLDATMDHLFVDYEVPWITH